MVVLVVAAEACLLQRDGGASRALPGFGDGEAMAAARLRLKLVSVVVVRWF
jgi:hypothetical protein